MTNLQHLESYFNCFPAYYEDDWNGYERQFKELIHHKRLDKEKIKKALNEEVFSWKEMAYWGDFFLYDPQKTELEIKIDYMMLTWKVLFPEKVLGIEEQIELRKWIQSHLSKEEWTNFDEIIADGKELFIPGRNFDYFNLLDFRKEIGMAVVDIKHQIGTDEWFFRLRN